MRRFTLLAVLVMLVGMAVPAWAGGGIGVGVGVGIGTGGNASTGHATGVGNSAVVGSGNSASSSSVKSAIHNDNRDTNTNVYAPSTKVDTRDTNVNVNGQQQQQQMKQQANNDGNHQAVEFNSPVQDRMPGLAVAPGLTAAGTGVCLGSVSIGLSGPMAGASFGITKVDKGCEQRSAAALLYQMGYKDAAVRLLMKNDDVREAMGTDAPASAKVATVVPVSAPEPVTVSSSQIFSESPLASPASASRIQGN